MKKRRRINLNCLLLIIGLAIGIWLGYNFASQKLNVLISGPPITPYPTNRDQRSLLVVGVDQLSAPEPLLKAVWYIAYLPDKPEINVVPLYPAIYEPFRAKNNELAAAFEITRSGELSPSFFSALETIYGLTSGEPVLLDDFALISLIDLLGGVEINGHVIKGKNAVLSIPIPLVNLDDAFAGQATLLNGLCLRAPTLKRRWQPPDLRMMIPDHLRTEFDIDQGLADWVSLNAIGSPLNCEINIPGQQTPP